MLIHNVQDNQKVTEVAKQIKIWCIKQNMQPPPWLTVESAPDEYNGRSFQSIFAEAFEKTRTDIASTSLPDIEQLGQQWIEDLWKDDAPKAKRKQQTRTHPAGFSDN